MIRRRLLRVFDVVLPSSVALVLAIIGAALSSFVVATTLLPSGPVVGTWVIWPLFLGFFPVHARSVRTLLLDRADLKRRLLGTPRRVLVSAAVLGACALALLAHGMFTSPGVPERHGAGYYVRNHTELTRVSRAKYLYVERLTERIFTGVALVFYLVAVVIHVGPKSPRHGLQDVASQS